MKQLPVFCFQIFIALSFLPSLHAQTNTPVSETNAVMANPAPLANQAPTDVMKKLSDLVHAGKNVEAQQLTSGLLMAYPGDQTLLKAKTLLDKLLSSSASSSPTPSESQSKNSIAQPSSQLTGMDKVEYNSLIELGREAQQTTDLDQQKTSLQRFMSASGPFLQKHPNEMLVWQLRAASAISLDDPLAGYEAGQKLLASGLADNDPNMQRLLAQLNLKGWLDKQKAEQLNYKKFGWILGTWNVSRSLAIGNANVGKAKKISGENMGEKEVFTKSGAIIEGYQISGEGVKSLKPDLRGKILDSGEINWECYLPPSESEGIYVFRLQLSWSGLMQGRTKQSEKVGQFYPSGWQPVYSSKMNSDNETLSISTPIQSSHKEGIYAATSDNSAILNFAKISSEQN